MKGTIFHHIFPLLELNDQEDKWVSKLHSTNNGPDCWCEPIVSFHTGILEKPNWRVLVVLHSTSLIGHKLVTEIKHTPSGKE